MLRIAHHITTINKTQKGTTWIKHKRNMACQSSKMPSQHKANSDKTAQNVAVIGAGPAGLACARELRDEGHFVTVYEQSSNLGGTWVLDNSSPMPGQPEDDKKRRHSSLYDSLRTNLPREVMSYTDFPFLPECMGGRSVDSRMYPSHMEVRAYLEAYADVYNLRQMIQFENQVTAVRLIKKQATRFTENPQWEVSSAKQVSSFDAIAICNGHFIEPYTPKIPGANVFPGKQSHSNTYRNARALEGKTVVVLGTSASGQDLSREIAEVADIVYLSGRRHKIEGEMNGAGVIGSKGNIFLKPNIAELKSTGGVLFDDGELLPHADEIVYCTGYEYSFPFLGMESGISTEGRRVSPLYKHMFVPALGPSLSLIGLTFHVIPFPLFEYQAKYLARLLSKRSELPSKLEMEEDIQKFYNILFDDGIESRHTHFLGAAQFEYIEWLVNECGPDVQGYPPWRREMFEEASRMKKVYPDEYRDLWTHATSVDAAQKDLSERYHKLLSHQTAAKI